MPTPQPSLAIRMVLILAFVCSTISLVGCGQQTATPANAPPPPPPVPAAKVTFCSSPAAGCTPATSFSVGSLRDLDIFVAWTNVPIGNHVQTLKTLLPNGGVYQTVDTSFVITDSSGGSFNSMQALPVAGSWISQRMLTGNWQVQVLLDGQAMGSQGFQLNP